MPETDSAPFTHGMEIEQFTGNVPRRAREYTMSNSHGVLRDWHNDGSGPRETAIGPIRNVHSVLRKFYADTRDEGITWDWHSYGTRHRGGRSGGAGSHLHLRPIVENFPMADELDVWTISHNAVTELVPVLAPFFCHDWEDGFREGRTNRNGQLLARKWADRNTRLSRDSVRRNLNGRASRSYKAVTFNPPLGDKPLTLELRGNDAHPAMALAGLLVLRRVVAHCIEQDCSPKLVNHRETHRELFTTVYDDAADMGLMRAMKVPFDSPIRFESDRGIPKVGEGPFDSPFDLLMAILREYYAEPGTWRARAHMLVKAGRDEWGPQANTEWALWHIDAPRGDFEWDNGPQVGPDPVGVDEPLTALHWIGEGKAEDMRAMGLETVTDVAMADVATLRRIPGVGKNLAVKLRQQTADLRTDRRGETVRAVADGGR